MSAALLLAVALPIAVSTASSGATVVLDHFECYSATTLTPSAVPGTPFARTAPAVMMKNGFTPSGMLAATGGVQTLCNPARKVLPSGATTGVTNPAGHFVCWALRPNATTLPSTVTLHNQFGIGVLHPVAARSLCVPSWKNPTTPTFAAATAPPGLDHYTCFTVTHPAGTVGFNPPAAVKLTDEFGTATTPVGNPNALCMASVKIITPPSGTGLVNPTHEEVCFAIPARASFTPRTVFAKNQFGMGALRVLAAQELCVPSTIVG